MLRRRINEVRKMKFTYTVTIEVERIDGPKTELDDIANVLEETLYEINPHLIYVEDTEYEITHWVISDLGEV